MINEQDEATIKQEQDNERNKMVGEIFLSIFPRYKTLKPQQSEADNEEEFYGLTCFLNGLKERPDWVDQLLTEVVKKSIDKYPPF